MHFFKHRVGSCNFCSTNILKCICHDRFLNILMECNPHLDRKGCSLVDGIGITALFIHHNKICDLSKFTAIFQHIRIYLEFFTPVFLFLYFFFHFPGRILAYQKLLIHIYHLLWRTFFQLHTLIQKDNSVTVSGNTAQIVAYKKDCPTHFLKFFEFTITFCLKEHIPYRKCLINDQNFRIDIDCNGKSQTNEHTTGICFDRLMYKIADVCKIQNILQSGINLLFGKTHHSSIEIYVLNPGILHIKPGSQFQQSGNSPIYCDFSASRIQYTGNDLEDRGFTGTICPDNSHCFSSFYIKADIP